MLLKWMTCTKLHFKRKRNPACVQLIRIIYCIFAIHFIKLWHILLYILSYNLNWENCGRIQVHGVLYGRLQSNRNVIQAFVHAWKTRYERNCMIKPSTKWTYFHTSELFVHCVWRNTMNDLCRNKASIKFTPVCSSKM